MQKNRKNSSQNHPKIVVIVSAAAALLGTLPLAALAGSPSKTASPKTDVQLGQRMADKSAHGPCAAIAKIDGELSPVRQQRLSSLGANITRHLGFIHSVTLTLPTHNLQKLAALSFVSHLSYDGEVKKCDEFTVASSGAGTAYQSYGLTGLGIGVAVMDSRMQITGDLSDPIVGGNRVVV